MPVRWTIDVDKRFMDVVATGDVTRPEVEAFLDAVMANGALGFGKLFNAGRARTSMAPQELLALGMRMRSMHFEGPMGPLAVVVPPEKGEQLDRMLGMIAAADRPMRIFVDLRRARRWIADQVADIAR
jgi:hypothetical protein